MCTSSIGFIVKASFFLPTPAMWGERAFVNGVYVSNPFFQTYKGDRVTIAGPSIPSRSRKQALTSIIRVPPFRGWEVDGLTRSVSLWAEPLAKELENFTLRKPVPFLTFRMYNWKYRH